jgi:hypothetical protein
MGVFGWSRRTIVAASYGWWWRTQLNAGLKRAIRSKKDDIASFTRLLSDHDGHKLKDAAPFRKVDKI